MIRASSLRVSATAGVALAAGLVLVGGQPAAALITSVFPYAVATPDSEYETRALLSVGDRVPETSDPAKQYQMIGIPDGLGAHRNADGTVTVFMNHELTGAALDTGGALSEPIVGDPLNRGAIVSKYILASDGDVLSGERAYDSVYLNDTLIGPAAQVGNATPPFARFCSGSLAGPEHGFDRYIYFG